MKLCRIIYAASLALLGEISHLSQKYHRLHDPGTMALWGDLTPGSPLYMHVSDTGFELYIVQSKTINIRKGSIH